MKILVIINAPPYGSQRSYNGLKLARSIGEREETELRVFLFGDGAVCAKRDQKVAQGVPQIEEMLSGMSYQGATIGVCVTCMDERGIREEELAEGCHKSTLAELTDWTLWADKVLIF